MELANPDPVFKYFFLSSTSVDLKERVLRGVMRVGLVAKGLILKGDQNLELVLLCSNKPTITLLQQVAERLTKQLEVGLPLFCEASETDFTNLE